MKKKPERFKPRLPEEARTRLHKGGAHTDKKRYDRKKDKQKFRQENDSFQVSCHIL